jgi:hypothetical protein
MRADTHDGPELNALQTKAGYIDARPLTTNSSKSPCDARPDHTFWLKNRLDAAPAIHCSPHRDSLFDLSLSLIRILNSLFSFLGKFDVSHWSDRLIAYAGFVNRSKLALFPVIFPVNRE